jgi:hypothetical protein
MYSRLGIFSFILLISGISSVLSGKFVYDCERKCIKTLEEKIVDLNIELLKCKHELKTLEDSNKFKESYSKLNDNLKLIKEVTDSDSFENLNQYDDSSSEDSSKSKIDVEFDSDDEDCKFNPLTNPSNDP